VVSTRSAVGGHAILHDYVKAADRDSWKSTCEIGLILTSRRSKIKLQRIGVYTTRCFFQLYSQRTETATNCCYVNRQINVSDLLTADHGRVRFLRHFFFVTAVVYSVQSVMGFFYMSPNLDSGVRPISAVTLAFNSRSATSSSLSTAETWWPEIGDAKRAYIQSDSTWGSTDLTPQHIRKLNPRQTGPGRSLVSTIALFILQYSRYVQ